MNNGQKSLSINETFIVEGLEGDVLSACTGFFTNALVSCTGNTQILLGVNIIEANSAFSATTFYGDGSNLTGVSKQDTFVTGGTYNPNSGVAIFTNNTGGTFSVTGITFQTPNLQQVTNVGNTTTLGINAYGGFYLIDNNDNPTVNIFNDEPNVGVINVNNPSDNTNLQILSNRINFGDSFKSIWLYPNMGKPSGDYTIATLDDVSGATSGITTTYVPYSGATQNVVLGPHSISSAIGIYQFNDNNNQIALEKLEYYNRLYMNTTDTSSDEFGRFILDANPEQGLYVSHDKSGWNGSNFRLTRGGIEGYAYDETSGVVVNRFVFNKDEFKVEKQIKSDTGLEVTTGPDGVFKVDRGNPNYLSFGFTSTDLSEDEFGTILINANPEEGIFLSRAKDSDSNSFLIANNSIVSYVATPNYDSSIVVNDGTVVLSSTDNQNAGINNNIIVYPNVTENKRLLSSYGGFDIPTSAEGQFFVTPTGNYLSYLFQSDGTLNGTPLTSIQANSEEGIYLGSIDTFAGRVGELVISDGVIQLNVQGDGNSNTTLMLPSITQFSNPIEVSGDAIIQGGLTVTTISATTYQNLPTDIRVTGASYNNNTFTFTNNTGGTFNILFNTVSGLTVNGNLTVTGNTSLRGVSATTISATTYQNLPSFVSGSGVNGQVSFWSGTTLQGGSNDLFWDNANRRLGIGTNTPGVALDVTGIIRSGSDIYSNGTFTNIVTTNGQDLRFRGSGLTTRMTMFQTTGNLVLQDGGTHVDAGFKLDVNGTARVSGTTTITPPALTGSSATNALDIAQTWNTTGTPTLIRANVTDTTSNANSNLMDLMVGNVSRFSVTKSGTVWFGSGTNFSHIIPFGTTQADSRLQITAGIGGAVGSISLFQVNTNNAITSTSNSPVLATFTSTFSPTSGTATHSVLRIAPNINQTGGANGITRGLLIQSTLTSAADFRAIESNNGRWVLTDTHSAGSGSLANPSLDINTTWNTSGTPSAIRLNVTDTTSNANSNLMDLRVGNVSRFVVLKSGAITFGNNFSSIIPFGTINADSRLQITAGMGGVVGDISLFTVNTNNAITSTSTNPILANFVSVFSPTSGTATYSHLRLAPTINQTGGANGITRGLFIIPTLTSAADWRSIENTIGNNLLNSTSGNTYIGLPTNTGTAKLQVRGGGTTSSTTSLRIENSASTASLIVNDAGTINIGVAPITVTDSNDILVRNSSTGNIEVRTVSSVTSNSIQKSVGSTYTTNSILAVTQAEYDALTPDPTTLYFII